VKKFLAFVFAALSGIYLVFLAWIPDPLPFIDEAVAFAILVKSLGVLGIHLPSWVPIIGRKAKTVIRDRRKVVDV
jgi:hypothetical protein